jgi:hypothetical protein
MNPPIKTLSPVSTNNRVEIFASVAGWFGVGVGVAEGFGVGVGVAVGSGVAVGVTVGVAVGVGLVGGVGVGGGALTDVVSVSELSPGFGSTLSDVMLAVFVKVLWPGVPGLTFTTRVKTAEVFFARVGFVAVTVPVAPTGGVVTVHPAGADMETKVVFCGNTSLTTTFVASLGLLARLAAVMV